MQIGIDIGGTFTDITCLENDGTVTTHKVLSTADDFSRAIIQSLPGIFNARGTDGGKVRALVHGTTVATNAILEQRGAVTALITTKGFRDVLELRRIRMPELYNWNWDKPPDLVERRFRWEVDERVGARGNVIRPLDLGEVERVVDEIASLNVQAIAVCLINSYVNATHEEMIARLIRGRCPKIPVSISSEILREVREYERTATVVVNSYVLPLVKNYIESLDRSLHGIGIQAPLLIMQSNGGVMTAHECVAKPVFIIESGPAAGVIASHGLAKRNGIANAITFDMGGTTTKASIIENNQISRAPEYEVGSSLSMVSRLIKGGGHLIRVPAIDVAEVGAGGGSIAWLDAAKALRIGPRSASAIPGPVCYDLGGTEATITDANLLLGYINAEGLVGGGVKLNRAKAEQAIRKQIAEPLGMELLEAAYGIHLVANSNMMRAVRSVSTERGRDIRDYLLIAFGGSGPIHACEMARALGMRKAVIPPYAGVFSAFGLLFADVEVHRVQTYYKKTREADLKDLNALVAKMEGEIYELFTKEGYQRSHVAIEWHADLRYEGQSYELTIPAPGGPWTLKTISDLERHFAEEHERTYGHRGSSGEKYSFVNLRATGKVQQNSTSGKLTTENSRPRHEKRVAYFGRSHGIIETPAISRVDLGASPIRGPLLIDEYDTTTVVAPDCLAWRDSSENIHIQIGG